MSTLENIVAWQGQLELLGAAWNLDVGRTAEFRIVEQPGEEPREHDFKRYQRRRGGRIGQRFHACFVPDGSEIPIYDTELMFLGWSDSDRGRSCKFWIDEDSSSHPFAGFKKRTSKEAGSFFAAVFVLITDDGQAVDQEAEDRLQGKKRKLSSDAHVMITGELFLQYLTERCEYTKKLERQHQVWTPDLAKRYVKHVLGIESLSDLDRDKTAAQKFHELFRTPFAIRQGRE